MNRTKRNDYFLNIYLNIFLFVVLYLTDLLSQSGLRSPRTQYQDGHKTKVLAHRIAIKTE